MRTSDSQKWYAALLTTTKMTIARRDEGKRGKRKRSASAVQTVAKETD